MLAANTSSEMASGSKHGLQLKISADKLQSISSKRRFAASGPDDIRSRSGSMKANGYPTS
jgi:hypothetical protein